MDKIDLPDWAGDDWVPKEGSENDTETLLIKAIKKINEIIDWINTQ